MERKWYCIVLYCIVLCVLCLRHLEDMIKEKVTTCELPPVL